MTGAISDAVSRIIEADSNLRMLMGEGLVNYYAFARKYCRDIVEELGRDASLSAIAMAARRFVKAREGEPERRFDFDLVVSDRMIDYNIRCDARVLDELMALCAAHGENEMNVSLYKDSLAIIVHEKNRQAIEMCPQMAKNIIFRLQNLACIHLRFKGDFLNTPGVIYSVLRLMRTKGINVLEIFSSSVELMFAINAVNLKFAYSLLKKHYHL